MVPKLVLLLLSTNCCSCFRSEGLLVQMFQSLPQMFQLDLEQGSGGLVLRHSWVVLVALRVIYPVGELVICD